MGGERLTHAHVAEGDPHESGACYAAPVLWLFSTAKPRCPPQMLWCVVLRQALPGWNVLLLAKEPVALNVTDCAEHDVIMAASGTQARPMRLCQLARF